MSAPCPCCSSTNPQTAIAARTCSTSVADSTRFICCPQLAAPRLGTADRQKFIGIERCATHQGAVDVRHREQHGGVARLDAATVHYAHVGGTGGRQLRSQGG